MWIPTVAVPYTPAMDPQPDTGPSEAPHIGYRTLMTLAALVVVVAGLKASGPLLLPFLVAVFFSILSAPPVLWLERKGWPDWCAVSVVMLGVFGLLTTFAGLVGTSLRGFSAALPTYRQRLSEQTTGVMDYLQSYGVEFKSKDLLGMIEPGALMDMFGSTINGLLTALGNTSLVVLTMVFILFEAAGFPRKLAKAVENPDASLESGGRIMLEIQRYLALKTVVSIATGILVIITAMLLGVDFPVLWGTLAFLFNFIPNVGSVLAAIPAVLVALIQLGPESAIYLGLSYVAINMVIGNAVEPKLMGDQLGLSPLVVFLSLVFWGWVWGPVGMLLSVPLTMVVKILFEQSDDGQWVAVLLGASPKE